MTKKTRIRVARIAAGAVIAAGASLAAAGAASAVGLGVDLPGDTGANVEVDEDGLDVGLDLPGGGGDDDEPTDPPTDIPTDPPTDLPTDPTDPTDEPTDPTDPTDEPTDPTDPTDEPTDPTDEPTEPGNGNGNGGGNGGGNDNTDPDGGNEPVEQGQGKEGLTDTAPQVPAEDQGKDKGELAETGAAETTFLLVGAATMIAGGVGFRMLPRLVGGGRGAAA